MMEHLTKRIRPSLMIFGILSTLLLLVPGTAPAWTSAHMFNVNIEVDLARKGISTVTTSVRFVVEGGYFHGFDMVNLEGAELDKTAGTAILDDKRTLPVTYKRVRGDRIRMLLDDDRYIRRGGITFQFVHKIDFAKTGALRSIANRARLDWTPLVWDVGLDSMAVTVQLPDRSADGPIEIDGTVAKDYVVEVGSRSITAIKYRPVKWYPMRIVMNFDEDLVAETIKDTETRDKTAAAVAVKKETAPPQTPPLRSGLFLALIGFLGLTALMMKARHVNAAARACGKTARFLLLSRTTLRTRVILAFLSVVIGVAVQWAGYLAAGIPAMVTAAALLIFKREALVMRLRPGGKWREMGEPDIDRMYQKLARYRRDRVSFFDITSLRGAIFFAVYTTLIVYLCIDIAKTHDSIMWASIIDSAVLAIPAWFGSIRAELPVNPVLEGFATLTKWRKSLSKLLGTKTPGSDVVFYVRENEEGPIEVRLRANPTIEGLTNIEVAGEIYRTGTLFRSRTVFVLRLVPASDLSKKLADCPGAAEHHLTPDLQEEIIVLRNRRGNTGSGLASLKTALSQMSG